LLLPPIGSICHHVTPRGPVPQDVGQEDDQLPKRGNVGDAPGGDVLDTTDQAARRSRVGIEVEDERAIGREIERAAGTDGLPPP
jgi:hypothetical protein